MGDLNVMPNPLRLHEFIAIEEGFFEQQGVDVTFEWQAFQNLMGAWGDYKNRPQDRLFLERKKDEVATACAWGSINNAGSGMGKWVPDAYQVSRHGIYVRPDSSIDSPADLANVEIAVGWMAGSHFNAMLRLEDYVPLNQIKPIPVGGYGRRLEALLNGEVEATSLLDPQIYMAEELGLRRIVGGTYEGLWWVDESVNPEALRKYLLALDQAENALSQDLPKYLPLWSKCLPAEFKDRDWDFPGWGHGTHFHLEPYPQEKYDRVMREMERWGLDIHM